MAATTQPNRWVAHALSAAIAALLIAAPTLLERVTPSFTAMAPLPDTQAVVPPTVPGPPGGIRPGAMETLPALVDAEARRLMVQQHAPGTALAMVHDGKLVLLRAYGTGDVERATPVEAARTLFRVGSVTKPLTAAALLRLVDEGRLDPHRDIRDYLPGLPLASTVTAHQLLTHTAGFDEKFVGGFTLSPDHLQPLGVYLPRFAHQAIQPGRVYSYGSTNYAVAGWLLERLTGLSYEDAMATRLFEPLGMTATTARQPPEHGVIAGRVHGYTWDGAKYHPRPFRYTQTGPAGALSTTAADMSRFMLAVLGDGSLDGARVLSPASRAALLRPQFRNHPRLPGVTYGFREWRTRGRVLLHHDGTLDDQVGVIVLDPDNAFGLFVASNSNPGIGNHLLEPVLRHLYGAEPAVPAPRALRSSGHAEEVAGVYLDLDRTRHDLSRIRAIMPMLQSRVAAAGDTIWWAGRQWTEVAPYVFQAPDSGEPLVFRQTAGAMPVMQTWTTAYERIGWTRQTPGHVAFAAACVLVFAICAVRFAVTRRRWREGRPARSLGLAVALANVIFLAWFLASIRRLGDTTPLPALDVAFLTLGVVAATGAALLPGCALSAWRDGWWTRGSRAAFTVLTVTAVAFAAWLDYWKLLGFRY
jgi:CubicO group peptidase (beta-lactamase class C family)